MKLVNLLVLGALLIAPLTTIAGPGSRGIRPPVTTQEGPGSRGVDPSLPIPGPGSRGGGDVMPEPKLEWYDIIAIIDGIKVPLLQAMKHKQVWWDGNGCQTGCTLEEYKQKQIDSKSVYQKLFLGKKETAITLIPKLKFVAKVDGPCLDNGQPHEGGAFNKDPLEICLSVDWIAKRVTYSNVKDYILGLAAHEVSHKLGANESEANVIRDSVSIEKHEFTSNSFGPVVGTLDNLLGSAIKDINQLLNEKVTAAPEYCARLGTMGGLFDFMETAVHTPNTLTDVSESEWRKTVGSDFFEFNMLKSFCAPPGSQDAQRFDGDFKNGLVNIDSYNLQTTQMTTQQAFVAGHYRNQDLSRVGYEDSAALTAGLIALQSDLQNSQRYFQARYKFEEKEFWASRKRSEADIRAYEVFKKTQSVAPTQLQNDYLELRRDGHTYLKKAIVDSVYFSFAQRMDQVKEGSTWGKRMGARAQAIADSGTIPLSESLDSLAVSTADAKTLAHWNKFFRDGDYKLLMSPINGVTFRSIELALTRLQLVSGELARHFSSSGEADSGLGDVLKALHDFQDRAGFKIAGPETSGLVRVDTKAWTQDSHALELAERIFYRHSNTYEYFELEDVSVAPHYKIVTFVASSGLSYRTSRCKFFDDGTLKDCKVWSSAE